MEIVNGKITVKTLAERNNLKERELVRGGERTQGVNEGGGGGGRRAGRRANKHARRGGKD